MLHFLSPGGISSTLGLFRFVTEEANPTVPAEIRGNPERRCIFGNLADLRNRGRACLGLAFAEAELKIACLAGVLDAQEILAIEMGSNR